MSNSNQQEQFQNKIHQSFIKRYATVAGIVITIVVVWFLFLIMPVNKQIKKYTQDVKEWVDRIKLASVQPGDMNRLEKNVDSLSTEIASIEKKIYYLEEMPTIAKKLLDYATDHQLQIHSMVPNYTVLFPVDQVEAQGKPLVKLPIEIQMIGLFISAGKFIEDVDRLPFAFAADEVTMEADAKYYPKIRITVKGYLFLLNEETNQITVNNRNKITKTGS